MAPELVQEQATAENISNSVLKLLDDTVALEAQRREMLKIKDLLGGPGASAQVADIALNMLKQ